MDDDCEDAGAGSGYADGVMKCGFSCGLGFVGRRSVTCEGGDELKPPSFVVLLNPSVSRVLCTGVGLRPRIHNIRDVDASQSSRKVPTSMGAIRHAEVRIGRRQQSVIYA